MRWVCGAGTARAGMRIRPHAFPRAKPDIKGHATDNVEHTWEAHKTSLSKRVSWHFSALSDLAPQHPHGTIEKQQAPIETSSEYIQQTYSFSKWAREAASLLFSSMGIH